MFAQNGSVDTRSHAGAWEREKEFCLLVGTAHPTIDHRVNLLRLNKINNFTGQAGDADYFEDQRLAVSY
jgi:hypothetical protein